MLTGIRRRRWSGAEADSAHRGLGRLPVRLIDDRRNRKRAWELARRFDNHPIYDLLYVAVAERSLGQLITADPGLLALLVDFPRLVAPGPIET